MTDSATSANHNLELSTTTLKTATGNSDVMTTERSHGSGTGREGGDLAASKAEDSETEQFCHKDEVSRQEKDRSSKRNTDDDTDGKSSIDQGAQGSERGAESLHEDSDGKGRTEPVMAQDQDDNNDAIQTEQEGGNEEEDDDEDEDDEDEDDEDEDEDEDEEEEDDDDDDDDDEDDEDEEEILKFVRLTQHLGGVYRNGDATSSFMVAGDKMIIGTHNGNIHVIQLPMFQAQRVYHAHSASVTAMSVSPYPPPLPTEKLDPSRQAPKEPEARPSSRQSDASPATKSRQSKQQVQIPRIPSNDIYVATASMDGNVCVQSLVDVKDVQLRNFARPVQAVALSPEYKSDRTYLSGGLAGQLILTVGGGTGRSTSTTTGTVAATASGWLGSIGLSNSTGKDTILHSGEGAISCIKWSLSGKYVMWLNEHGIKIMRSSLHAETADSADTWKRIGHFDRPQTEEWDTMAGVWKGRAEWIDEKTLSPDETEQYPAVVEASTPATEKLQEQAALSKRQTERLIVGWGGTIWIIHVYPESTSKSKRPGEKSGGEAVLVDSLRMDCIISGIALYTENLLLVLAYCQAEDDDDDDAITPDVKGHKPKSSVASTESEPRGGITRKHNNQPPELRLVDVSSKAEVERNALPVSRFERLTSGDYHLGVLPARNAASAAVSSRGALEALAGFGTGVWNAAINPTSLFSSGASVRSRDSADEGSSGIRFRSAAGTLRSTRPAAVPESANPGLVKPGAKIFVNSPYDCILGIRKDLTDHLQWLQDHQKYQKAWELLDENADILELDDQVEARPDTPTRNPGSIHSPRDDESALGMDTREDSATEKRKRHIGNLWVQQLIDGGDWIRAGQICGKVIKTPDRWSKWICSFTIASKFDEIVDFVPAELLQPPIPTSAYETILNHYLSSDKVKFRELLDRWSTDLFHISVVTTALDNQLKYRDVREDSIDGGEKGRDWRIVMESLAKLHEANGRHREALRCFIRLQDADSAFRLIRDSHLADAVADDIPGFISLRVLPENLGEMSVSDLEEATSEAINLLVDEAQHGLVQPRMVVEQLQAKRQAMYLHFYFKALWKGKGLQEHGGENMDRLVMESQALVDEYADLAVHLFARFDRSILMDLLRTSTSYTFEKAVQECEAYFYYDELVYLYSKTGQVTKALFLIIDQLKNVQKAIEFAKEQDDPDLWEDLLNYSMDKPSFIRGLLEQVGTAINPITLVQRIPEGLEIQGLREGLTHMMKEHEIQYSISSGVSRVLRSEVATAQNELRTGQRKGVKFEVVTATVNQNDPASVNNEPGSDKQSINGAPDGELHGHRSPQPGHCAKCHEPFTEYDMETLIGYACGHVFHVSHLLEMLHKGKGVDVDFNRGEAEDSRYSVGLKVMRARLLRDKIKGGCPICHIVVA